MLTNKQLACRTGSRCGGMSVKPGQAELRDFGDPEPDKCCILAVSLHRCKFI